MRDSWMVLSIVAILAMSSMNVIITYLIRKGLSTVFVLGILFILVSAIYVTLIVGTHAKPTTLPHNFWLPLLAIGVLSAIGNFALYKASAIAPSPGLVMAVFGLQSGITAILAVVFLKDKLNVTQIIGICVGILAIVIIGLGSRPSKVTSSIDGPTSKTTAADKI